MEGALGTAKLVPQIDNVPFYFFFCVGYIQPYGPHSAKISANACS